ncbi:hypothetical protein P8452_18622 [Trifolium repens]|nr:hypothetical protein P8452_18622 [Trifolium repens]
MYCWGIDEDCTENKYNFEEKGKGQENKIQLNRGKNVHHVCDGEKSSLYREFLRSESKVIKVFQVTNES